MDDEDALLISKGCFVMPSARSKALPLKATSYLNAGMKTSLRWEMAQSVLKDVNEAVMKLHRNLQEKIFIELISFIEEVQCESTKAKLQKRCEIPTAALNTGVNLSDHALLFQELRTKLIECISPYVVSLQARDCSNVKSLMRSLYDQLTHAKSEQQTEEVCDPENGFGHKIRKTTPITLSIIEKWYEKVTARRRLQCSPRKKAKLKQGEHDGKPIIIMCQDFESFSQKLLRDFILTASFHVSRLPIVLVFGVATSWDDTSQRLLPHSAMVHLSVRNFTAPIASQHLTLIIDEILLTCSHPFKLSGRCLQLLVDVFLCHDFSIFNFLHAFRFCILEHFYEKPASVLCTFDMDLAKGIVKKLSKVDAEELFTLPSMRSYVSTLGEDEKIQLKKESAMKDALTRLLQQIYLYHQNYYPALRSLHNLTSTLPQYPLGKQLREVFIACSRNKLTEYQGYKQAFTFLKVSSRDQLIDRLSACVKPLQDNAGSDQSNDDLSTENASRKILSLIEDFEKLAEGNEDTPEEKPEEEEETVDLGTVKYAYQLQERLRSKFIEKRKKKMTKFERLRETALTYLKAFYERHLRHVQTLPLHEAFYYDSPAQIKRHLVAAPRLSIQTALADPYHYLKEPSLEPAVSGVIPSNAPDVCIAYKLHNESGALINLYDWMTAFHTIANAGMDVDEKENSNDERKDVEIDEITQARFIRAVSELQFLGFIKSTKKKTDHVQRLTWSHI